MIALKLIRKIGKMLRGGAGKKEIFLGALCGILIGFNPIASLTLALALLITLLLNANMGFTLLGAALGKILSIVLAPITFHTGYFIIHNMGLEGLFTSLTNTSGTALMGLNTYSMIGSLPFALILGIVFGKVTTSIVTKIREQMVKAGQHDKVGKVTGNKFSKFLIWLAFGKQKISTEDVLAKQSPLLRKSGLILVGSTLVIGIILEFFLLDLCVKKGLQTAISNETGAEVNIEKAHLSLASGTLELENLQVTDPDKLTHNLIQIDHLAADISISDLLRKSYTIDLLAGSTLKRDILRDKPGTLIVKSEKEKAEEKEELKKDSESGKSLDNYFAKAKDWKKYGDKAYDYLKTRKDNAETVAQGKKPKATKTTAVADAKKVGYLKASADLIANRPAWLIHQIQIDNVLLSEEMPAQTIQATEVTSHPEVNGQPTTFTMTPVDGTEPSAKLTLRFDNPDAPHEIAIQLANLSIGGAVETSDDFPININDGKADIKASGTFSADQLDLPFSLTIHNLKADVEDGKNVMGMDSKTATEVFSSIEQLEIDGALGGSLLSPRVNIDHKKLTANLKTALLAAGKKELSNRANKEMDKAKAELSEKAGEEINKLLGGKEGESTEEKAKGLLKKLF